MAPEAAGEFSAMKASRMERSGERQLSDAGPSDGKMSSSFSITAAI